MRIACRQVVQEELAAITTALQVKVSQEIIARTSDAVAVAAGASLNVRNATAIGVFQALGMILATRFLLLLAWAGSIALAVMALNIGTYQALGMLIAYAILVLGPLVLLEIRQRPAVPPVGSNGGA